MTKRDFRPSPATEPVYASNPSEGGEDHACDESALPPFPRANPNERILHPPGVPPLPEGRVFARAGAPLLPGWDDARTGARTRRARRQRVVLVAVLGAFVAGLVVAVLLLLGWSGR
mgnify:FL=1